MALCYEAIEKETSNRFKKIPSKVFSYGTAGFRTKADDLETVLFRMGILAALRSKATKAHIGLMITASHNPACDNGVKIVDPLGEMMAQDWEQHATRLANADDNQLINVIKDLIAKAGIDENQKARVVVARDTRPSSDKLHTAAVAAIAAMGGEVVECGVVSTPVLHYRVVTANDGGRYGVPTNAGYIDKLVLAYVKLQTSSPGLQSKVSNYEPAIAFDGANGVGGRMMATMIPALKDVLSVNMYNDGAEGSTGVLNYMCGADYVKSSQSWPNGVPKTYSRCVSVDGDADRVIYSSLTDDGQFVLLDGDKMATLIAGYLKEMLALAGLDIKLGLVQTAYANGGSTKYINGTLGVPVGCAKTGVKFVHHMAQQYDIGVYFEANGHGTVLFSDTAKRVIRAAADSGNSVAARLSLVVDVVNETVGDAISDMFLVEVILKERGWSAQDWNKQYTDIPNRLVKVRVSDRNVISTTNAERTCTAPASVQPAIDALLASEYSNASARAFIRPSGTEDVVRVYAEAATQEQVEKLTKSVSQIVYDFAGGVGERP